MLTLISTFILGAYCGSCFELYRRHKKIQQCRMSDYLIIQAKGNQQFRGPYDQDAEE